MRTYLYLKKNLNSLTINEISIMIFKEIMISRSFLQFRRTNCSVIYKYAQLLCDKGNSSIKV